jgi:putative membrane protein insertion efficiency factor
VESNASAALPPASGGIAARTLIGMVRIYQLVLSPILPASCRFVPSCSEYAREALARHGAIRGSWMAVRRLSRCHPFHPGGFDPVDRSSHPDL